MNKSRLSIVLIALMVSSLVLFGTVHFGKAQSALVAPTVTTAPVTVDQGQTSVLSSSAVTTGSGGYTYQWFAKAPSGSYATVGTSSTSYNFITSVSNATGSWGFILQVTDSTGAAVNSTAASVTVNARAALPPWVSDLLIAIVVIAVLLIIILFAWRKRTRKMSRKKNQPADVAVQVTKVEIADNTVKFFVAKGRRKKKWVIVKEIPVYEITHIENLGNQLSVTWKDVTDAFFTKEKTDLFSKLVGQVNGMLEDQLEDQRKSKENNEKAALRKIRRNELLGVINTSIGIIDSSFNVLIGLQEKRINWQRIEGYTNGFGENLSFTGQTMPPLNLDFSKIASAVKSQLPKETSNEAYSILKAAYGYFNGLSLDDDPKENQPNFHDAKAVISAYFMLNDLLLGKIVGDKENKEEISQLESALQNLAAETNFKVNIDELKSTINKIDVDSNRESVIERSREIFKQQLKQQLKPKEESLTTTQPVSKVEVSTEPVTEPVSKVEVSTEPVTEPVSKDEKKQKGIQVSKVEVSDNIAKFFAAKGFRKKQWIVVKEIPLLEIEHIEKFGNELSVTWKGATYTFFTKEKTDLFGKLVDQVNGILEGVSTEPAAPPTNGTQPAPEAALPPDSSHEVQA